MKKFLFIQKIALILIVLGVTIVMIGFYYEGIKAGIPYQDPTPELLNQYNNYIHTGQTLYKAGSITGIIGCVLYVIIKFIKNSKN